MRHQRLFLRRREPGCQPPDHQILDLRAQLEQVLRLFQTGRGHRRAAIVAQFHQTFRRQPFQRLPDNRAARAEPFAQRILRQFHPGQQRAFKDRRAQRDADHFRPVLLGLPGGHLPSCLIVPTSRLARPPFARNLVAGAAQASAKPTVAKSPAIAQPIRSSISQIRAAESASTGSDRSGRSSTSAGSTPIALRDFR